MSGRKAGEAFRNALVWLLAKPFAQQKSFVLENVEVPVWEGKNTAGLLRFADTNFTADAKPIRKETAKACVQTRFCPEIKMEGDEFVLVSNFTDAQTICRQFGRELIDKETLLRLSLTDEGSNLLDEENGAAWHSGGETGYFKERSDHQEFVQAKTTGAVWCKLAIQETSPTFEQGTYIWSDGRKYEGEFKDGKPNGKGTLTYPDSRKYVGEFKNGKENGFGTLTSPDEGKYVGEWKDGKRNGFGTLTSPDGSKSGLRQRKTFTYSSLGRRALGVGHVDRFSKYEGAFKDDKPNGQGIYTSSDGRKYVGEWKDGLPNGQGIFNWPDGEKSECNQRTDCRCVVEEYDRYFSSRSKYKRLKELCF